MLKSPAVEHMLRVGDCKFTSYILSSFFGDFSVQQTMQFFSTARAWRSLPAVRCASIPKGAHSTDEVWSVSQAIKESVSRKMEKPNWDWKHSLPVYLPYVSSWLILLVNNMGGRAVGMGHIFLLLDIKELDVGQYCGVSRLFTLPTYQCNFPLLVCK